MGSGAFISAPPQPPLKLSSSEVLVGKSFTLSWEVPENDGRTPIIDYTIYEEKNGDYIVLESGITENSFVASWDLLAEMSYTYAVSARNIIGESLRSASLVVVPIDIPTTP